MKHPAHPGRIVRAAIDDLGVSVTGAAAALNVSSPTLSNLLNGKARVSPEMAVRLSKAIGSAPAFCLRLQMNHDLAQVKQWADSIVVRPLSVSTRSAV